MVTPPSVDCLELLGFGPHSQSSMNLFLGISLLNRIRQMIKSFILQSIVDSLGMLLFLKSEQLYSDYG